MGREKAKGFTQNAKGWAYRFVYNGNRYSVSGKTQGECRKKAEEKKAKLEARAYSTNSEITLDEYFKEWAEQKGRVIKGSTLFTYSYYFKNHISPELGGCKIMELERRQVVRMINHVADHGGIGAANYIRRLIVSILNGAVQDGIIMRSVAARIPMLKSTRPPARETIHRELTEQEIKDFFLLIGHTIYQGAFELMLYTGLRVGECLGLQWRDIDFKRGLIHVRRTVTRNKVGELVLGDTPKTRKSRRDIPMNEAIRDVIRKQLEYSREMWGSINVSGLVFPNEKGLIASPSVLGSAIHRSIKRGQRMNPKIILKPFSLHAFRDTFASRAIRAGILPNTLKEILGHSSLAMTMDLYAHVNQQDKVEGMKKMLAISF